MSRRALHRGHCLCGAVRIELRAEPEECCFCHCESCRRATGAPFVAWGTVETEDFAVTGGALRLIASSPGVERGFCAQCGSSVSYAEEGRPTRIDVALALLDDAEQLQIEAHIWVEDALPWMALDDGLSAFERDYEGEAGRE